MKALVIPSLALAVIQTVGATNCTSSWTSTTTVTVSINASQNVTAPISSIMAMSSSYNGTFSLLTLTGELTNPLINSTVTSTALMTSFVTVPGMTSTVQDNATLTQAIHTSVNNGNFSIETNALPTTTVDISSYNVSEVKSTGVLPKSSAQVTSSAVKVSASMTMTSYLTTTSTFVLTQSVPSTVVSGVASSNANHSTSIVGTLPLTTITVSPLPLVVIDTSTTEITIFVHNTTAVNTVVVVPTQVANSTMTVTALKTQSTKTSNIFTEHAVGNTTTTLLSSFGYPDRVTGHVSATISANNTISTTSSMVFLSSGSYCRIPQPFSWVMNLFKRIFATGNKTTVGHGVGVDQSVIGHPERQFNQSTCPDGWVCSTTTTWLSTTTLYATPTASIHSHSYTSSASSLGLFVRLFNFFNSIIVPYIDPQPDLIHLNKTHDLEQGTLASAHKSDFNSRPTGFATADPTLVARALATGTTAPVCTPNNNNNSSSSSSSSITTVVKNNSSSCTVLGSEIEIDTWTNTFTITSPITTTITYTLHSTTWTDLNVTVHGSSNITSTSPGPGPGPGPKSTSTSDPYAFTPDTPQTVGFPPLSTSYSTSHSTSTTISNPPSTPSTSSSKATSKANNNPLDISIAALLVITAVVVVVVAFTFAHAL